MNAIVKAIKNTEDFSSVIVVVSGDITFAGMVSQYNVAYRFFANLKNQIKTTFDIGQVEFCVVLENHNVNHSDAGLSHDELEKIFNDHRQDECLVKEKEKMRAFYNHANGLHCFSDKNSLVYIKEIVVGETTLRFNLINTGVYSLKR